MEDMMKALLDVVRAQHTATEGSEERPFDINDIIDMALNITGRPEEPEEQQELSDTIQKLAESLTPDIFPPKTFEGDNPLYNRCRADNKGRKIDKCCCRG